MQSGRLFLFATEAEKSVVDNDRWQSLLLVKDAGQPRGNETVGKKKTTTKKKEEKGNKFSRWECSATFAGLRESPAEPHHFPEDGVKLRS